MDNVIEQFDATPGTNLLDVLGNSGYSLQAAIADIIDNSISAKSKNIYITFSLDGPNSYISIVDDGIGMNLKKLKEASTIAYKNVNEERKASDLGRFSTGINSASASVCSKLTIQSKVLREKNYNTILIDYARMKEEKKWICKVIDSSQNYLNKKSGTAIVWSNLKDIALAQNDKDFYKKISVVEKHVAHVFNDYIKNGINIWINNNLVKGWDPFFQSNLKTTKITEEKYEYHGSVISFQVFILPPFNNLNQDDQAYMKGYGLSEQQGFYIYRKNRLIKEGSWLDIEDLSISNKYDYARIRVDIENSVDKYFKPNFLKNEIAIPDDLISVFKRIALNARSESRKNYNYMKAPSIARNTKSNKNITVWNTKNTSDGLLLSINEKHPSVHSLCKNMSDKDRKRLFKLISNSIPIGEISRSGMSPKQNSVLNLDEEIKEMYELLKSDGLSDIEIMKKMSSCEPFCSSDESISKIIDFFEEKGMFKS